MSSAQACHNVFALVRAIGLEVEKVSVVREEGRRFFRFIRRVEVCLSDVQPYLSTSACVWCSLKEIEAVLIAVHQDLQEIAVKGPLALYLQADRALAKFQAASERLGKALDGLITAGLRLPEETLDELHSARALFQRARFELPPEHKRNLSTYRAACEALRAPFEAMLESCEQMLQQAAHTDLLTKEGFAASIQELQQEVERLAASPARAARRQDYYLRMMMDVIRVHHVQLDTPLEYLCPLTHQIMQDPVLLHETGFSYERKALEDWFKKGCHFCPRSGVALKRLNISANTNLKEAITRWRLHSDMQLAFRPILNRLVQEEPERGRLERSTSSASDDAVPTGAALSSDSAEACGGSSQVPATSTPPLSCSGRSSRGASTIMGDGSEAPSAATSAAAAGTLRLLATASYGTMGDSGDELASLEAFLPGPSSQHQNAGASAAPTEPSVASCTGKQLEQGAAHAAVAEGACVAPGCAHHDGFPQEGAYALLHRSNGEAKGGGDSHALATAITSEGPV